MRLFFGLTLPDDVRAETARLSADARRLVPGRYADPANHHVTLAFLGDVESSRLADAQAVLADGVLRFSAPRLTLDRADHFGRAQNGILILRVSGDLAPLHDALVRGLREANLPADPGPFAPHITLARHADVTCCDLTALAPAPLAFLPREAHVFLSARDDRNILRYTPLFAAPFASP